MNTNGERQRCRQLQAVVERASLECPFWRDALASPPRFSSFAEFAREIPIVDHVDLFTQPWVSLIRRDADGLDAILLSSGTTGGPRAVGLLDQRGRARERSRLAAALHDLVAAETGRALLINALPDGVALELPGVFCVATGGRAGPGVEILAQLGPRFDPIIVAGEPSTVLALLELGHTRGLDLAGLPIRVVTGGSFLLESTRARFAALLGLDLDVLAHALRAPLSSFGMSEVGMHLLWETPATVMVRRVLDRSGIGCFRSPHPVPCLMTYDPEHLHVEIVDGELVLSKLDADALQPIIRYNSHDRCEPVDPAAVARLLALADPDGVLQLPQPLIWIGMRDADPASLQPEVRR